MTDGERAEAEHDRLAREIALWEIEDSRRDTEHARLAARVGELEAVIRAHWSPEQAEKILAAAAGLEGEGVAAAELGDSAPVPSPSSPGLSAGAGPPLEPPLGGGVQSSAPAENPRRFRPDPKGKK